MEYISYRLPKGSLLCDTMEQIRNDWSDLVHEEMCFKRGEPRSSQQV